MTCRQKRPNDNAGDGPSIAKRICRHPHHTSSPSDSSVSAPIVDSDVMELENTASSSSSLTAVTSTRYDLTRPSLKLSSRRPRPRPHSPSIPSSSSVDRVAERRRLLPRINTCNLQLSPSPQPCASPNPSQGVHVPLHVPPIRGETLRELDLEAILGNVQLRHDLLFDPGLQFRPLTSRRKRTSADRYWIAIQRELETGCTCTSFDHQGNLLPCLRTTVNPRGIAWGRPRPEESVISPYPSPPSRIPALITELREVMLSVMVPSPLPPPCPSTDSRPSSDSSSKVSDAFSTQAMQVSARMVAMALNPIVHDDKTPQQPLSPTDTVSAPSPTLSTSATLVPPSPSHSTASSSRLPRIPVLHPQLSAQTTFQHSQVRAALDLPLVIQQITHGVFDPAELFTFIGQLIKFHCAPMRDAAVEDVVATAKIACAEMETAAPVAVSVQSMDCLDTTRRNINLSKVVLAIRKCFDLFELMKLDIANHQLQFLRKYLFRTSRECELGALYDRQLRSITSLDLSRQWISRHIVSTSVHRLPNEPKSTTIDRALCDGIVNLILHPPHSSPAAAATFAQQVFLPPPSPIGGADSTPSHLPPGHHDAHHHYSSHHHQQPQQAPMTPAPGFPETLWLDHTRLSALGTDAADLTAAYMMLMLYRQCVHSSSPGTTNTPAASQSTSTSSISSFTKVQIKVWELARVKREIWQIGPQRPGWCFFRGGFGALPIADNRQRTAGSSASGAGGTTSGAVDEEDVWRRGIKDVILQVALRARETASGANTLFASEADSGAPFSASFSSSASYSLSKPLMPDSHTVDLLGGWMESNMKEGSTMHDLLRKRLRDAMLEVVLGIVLPPKSCTTNPDPSSSSHSSFAIPPATISPAQNGLEPLMPEIRQMGERIAKLVSLHSYVYHHIYDAPGFILDA